MADIFGVMTKKDPINPKNNPSSVYATSLEKRKVKTTPLLFFEFSILDMAEVNRPPCMAIQDIPPEVKPVINANQIVFIV
jgi:hypothetical protein